MVNKTDCIGVFNAMIRGTPISFSEKLLPMFSDFLTENNIEKSDKMINLIVQNPQLIQQAMPKIIEYFCRKYCILSLVKMPSLNSINPKKTILYYE